MSSSSYFAREIEIFIANQFVLSLCSIEASLIRQWAIQKTRVFVENRSTNIAVYALHELIIIFPLPKDKTWAHKVLLKGRIIKSAIKRLGETPSINFRCLRRAARSDRPFVLVKLRNDRSRLQADDNSNRFCCDFNLEKKWKAQFVIFSLTAVWVLLESPKIN